MTCECCGYPCMDELVICPECGNPLPYDPYDEDEDESY